MYKDAPEYLGMMFTYLQIILNGRLFKARHPNGG
jgi:hypothetical protein